MLPRILPLLAGILPFVAIGGAFVIGVVAGSVPSCNPFIDGCVSISATGRRPPGSFLFRAIMLPYSAVLLFLWYTSILWLRQLNPESRRPMTVAIGGSGYLGAFALVVYVTFLGTQEPVYEFMRRIGIYFGFLGTGVAQLLLSLALVRIAAAPPHIRWRTIARWLLGLSLSQFLLGIILAVFKPLVANPDPFENGVEWTTALIMQIYFLVLFLAWNATNIRASVTVGTPEGR